MESSPQQWERMSNHERSLLRERLGQDEQGVELHPLPAGHSFRAEQDALACYSFPGWEQRRGLPHFCTFEHPDGRSKTSEETKCATGKTVTEWDVEHVAGLVKGAGKLSGKKGSASKRPNWSRGVFVFCCSHRVIYGFHTMLRGESPQSSTHGSGARISPRCYGMTMRVRSATTACVGPQRTLSMSALWLTGESTFVDVLQGGGEIG
jgi:hypothetical protein